MASGTTTKQAANTVRIWSPEKERLQKVVLKKAEIEKRTVYEVELVNKAINDLCEIEEKRLGM